MTDQQAPEQIGWAIVELMGHRRLGAFVTEQEIAGTKMLRLDIYPGEPPDSDEDEQPEATQFYSASSLYCLTPTTEEIARAVADLARPEPVRRWELAAPADADTTGGDWQ